MQYKTALKSKFTFWLDMTETQVVGDCWPVLFTTVDPGPTSNTRHPYIFFSNSLQPASAPAYREENGSSPDTPGADRKSVV